MAELLGGRGEQVSSRTELWGGESLEVGASLPRPSKSTSRNGAGNRSSTSSIDSNISSKSAGLPVPKLREPSKTALGSSLPGLVNQTDKEKGISSDNESVASCNSVKVNPAPQPVSSVAQATLQPGAKYPDVASPTLRR